MTPFNLVRWIWLNLCLWGWRWVEIEQCASHRDAPLRVLRIRYLREEIARTHPTGPRRPGIFARP